MQLVSESVKTKQAYSSLQSEKQALAKQLQQINALIDSSKIRIAHIEEQVQLPLLPGPQLIFYFIFIFCRTSSALITVVNNNLNPADEGCSIGSH